MTIEFTMKTIQFLILAASLIGCGRPQNQQNADGNRTGRTVIQNKGSDTLVNVAQAWAEAYKDIDANVAIAVTGGGSGTGISSMTTALWTSQTQAVP